MTPDRPTALMAMALMLSGLTATIDLDAAAKIKPTPATPRKP